MPASGLPGPLARLYQTAMRLGITVLDDAAVTSRWPDENTAAIVSFGEHIALKPGNRRPVTLGTMDPDR